MRIKTLQVNNIGPFESAFLEFISDDDSLETPPVIIITGENGTGKSIVLDSIRTIFMGIFSVVERDITAKENFQIKSEIVVNELCVKLLTNGKNQDKKFNSTNVEIGKLFHSQFAVQYKRNFIFDYWTSKLSNDSFSIDSISTLNTNSYLDGVLNGVHKNIDVTRVITFFDYLKDSSNESERLLGKSLYEIIENIINVSIVDGKLSHVSRINLKPIIKTRNHEVSLDKLSSGNIYLIQRFVSLLKQVYSICVNNDIPISNYKEIKGVLLIDEAENHLHPKWQKVLLKNILLLFPRLQIIVTTHSPFIVSSVENAKTFVCKGLGDSSYIEEETDFYSNKPIEEILMSPLFNTNNFNTDISKLIRLRKEAQDNSDLEETMRIENILLKINPEYFNYLNINNLLASLKNESTQ